MDIVLTWGISDSQRVPISEILYDSLGDKFVPVLGDRSKGIPFVSQALNGDRLLLAVDDERVVGVVGLQFRNKGYMDISIRKAWKFLGKGIFRMIYNGWILEQKTAFDILYLDTIAVTAGYRGKGIGNRMVHEVIRFARSEGLSSVKLSVINTNNRAKQLYERLGFREVAVQNVPFPWSRTFGFTRASEMVNDL